MKSTAQPKELFSTQQIQSCIHTMAARISEDYRGKELHLVGVLKGSFIFTADVCRALNIPCYIHFLHASSYANAAQSSGQVSMRHSLKLLGKHVLILEDILDTGLTLNKILEDMKNQQPASLKIGVLLVKNKERSVAIHPDYAGFTIANEFVVGYGLDLAEQYRALPYIARLD